MIGMIQGGEVRKQREWNHNNSNAPYSKGHRGMGNNRSRNAGQRNNHMRQNNRGDPGSYMEGMDGNPVPKQRNSNRGYHQNTRYNSQGGNQKPYYNRNYKSEFGENNGRDGMMNQRQHDPMSPPREYYREKE